MVGFGSPEKAYEMETQAENLRLCPICNKRISDNDRADKVYCSKKCQHKAWRSKNKEKFNKQSSINTMRWHKKNVEKGLCPCGREPLPEKALCERCSNFRDKNRRAE